MDGDSVDEPPSEDTEYRSLAEMFEDIFPYYIVMGMTYDEYWNGCPSLVRSYRKAWKIKRQNDEYDRWRRGLYFYDALCRVAPYMRTAFSKSKVEPLEYPKEPYPVTMAELHQREERDRRINYYKMRSKLIQEAKEESKRAKQEASKNGDD